MYFSHVKGYMSILYIGCMKFLTNCFCPIKNKKGKMIYRKRRPIRRKKERIKESVSHVGWAIRVHGSGSCQPTQLYKRVCHEPDPIINRVVTRDPINNRVTRTRPDKHN